MIEIARKNMLWLNASPVKASVSQEVSPHALVTGNPTDYKKHCRCPLLSFVHTHESIDNADKPRTIGSIFLGPTWNDQGTYVFLNLATGKHTYQVKCTELPTPQYSIDHVHQLADKDYTSENSDCDPSKNTDDKNSVAEDHTNNQQT